MLHLLSLPRSSSNILFLLFVFHCCIKLLFNSDKDVFYANDLTAKNLNKDVCFDSGKNVEGHFTPLTPNTDWYVISPYNFSIRPSGQMIRIKKIINKGKLSGCNTRFSRSANIEMHVISLNNYPLDLWIERVVQVVVEQI